MAVDKKPNDHPFSLTVVETHRIFAENAQHRTDPAREREAFRALPDEACPEHLDETATTGRAPGRQPIQRM